MISSPATDQATPVLGPDRFQHLAWRKTTIQCRILFLTTIYDFNIKYCSFFIFYLWKKFGMVEFVDDSQS